jgi:hypothetical protein
MVFTPCRFAILFLDFHILFPPLRELFMGYLILVFDLENITELTCLNPPQNGGTWFSGDFCDLTDPQITFHNQMTQLIQLIQSNHIEKFKSIHNLTVMI